MSEVDRLERLRAEKSGQLRGSAHRISAEERCSLQAEESVAILAVDRAWQFVFKHKCEIHKA